MSGGRPHVHPAGARSARARRRPGWLVVAAALTAGACSADRASAEGRAHLDAHELSQAEADFRKALSREPDHADALDGLGWTYHLAGQRDAAAGVFDRCLTVEPTHAGCLRGKAQGALAEGNPVEARQWLEKAAAAAPGDPKVVSSVALLDMASGDLDAAASAFQTLAARYPDKAEYPLSLAEVRLRQGQPDAALELVDGALALVPGGGVAVRHQALLHVVRARALVSSTAGRVDPTRCPETAPPVLAWLVEADAALDRADALGIESRELGETRRQVLRRRAAVEDECPARLMAAQQRAEAPAQPGSEADQ